MSEITASKNTFNKMKFNKKPEHFNISIRADVLLIIQLILLCQFNLQMTKANDIVPSEISKGLPLHGDLSDISMYENIHRILRDEESTLRKEEERWVNNDKKVEPKERRFRRDVDAIDTRDFSDSDVKMNGTKVLDFSNKKLRVIDFNILGVNDTILSDALVLNFSNNNIKILNDNLPDQVARVEYLDLSSNDINYFNSSFNKLIKLNLEQNELTSFKSDYMKNINVLNLAGNNFSDPNEIELEYLVNLERIDLSCNEFQDLHYSLFQKTTNVIEVNISYNRLTRVQKNYFYNLINIEVLLLAHNNISEIDNDTFAYLPNLQFLDLSHNRIDATSIRSLQGIPDLIGLSLAYNPELGDALQGFVASWSLKELDISGTGLCQIPVALAQSVHTLNVSDNHFQVCVILINN